MAYIVDSIGEEYKEWGKQFGCADGGGTAFISSPTGSGKTTFILNEFLPYMVQQNKKILYLVNRSILKKQMEEKIKRLPIELKEGINVELYQTIEKKYLSLDLHNISPEYVQGYYAAIQKVVPEQMQGRYLQYMPIMGKQDWLANRHSDMQNYERYDCVVCDECHYFLMDSNYNTNTIFSYNFIKDFFGKKLKIYMSATIESIQRYIEEDEKKSLYVKTYWFGFHGNFVTRQGLIRMEPRAYMAERNYDLADIQVLYKKEDIAKLVTDGTKKWLIFVDNKEFGKKLKKEIEKNILDNKSVTCITSDYAHDPDCTSRVGEIISENKSSAKVVIATSVLDNGITIEDFELRNIIVLADVEVEFIQMLGRKRNDNQKVKLYIYKRDREHFARRQRINDIRLKIATENYMAIHQHMEKMLKQETDIDYIERNLIEFQHKLLMQKIANNEIRCEDVKATFTALNGVWYLNPLSLRNLENLSLYYEDILKKFDELGEEAFLYEQLSWLGKSKEEIEAILSEARETQYEKCYRTILKELQNVSDKALNCNEMIELKEKVRRDIIVLVEDVNESIEGRDTVIKAFEKNDRPISEKNMKFLREHCKLPFSVEVKKSKENRESTYIVRNVPVE